MLHLRRDLLEAMAAHCRAEHPIEACGVLTGRDGFAERHIPMRNAEASRTRYAMNPDQQLAVWREMDARGEQPVVIYHSHTATEAYPSTPDLRYAAEPGAHYVIVSTRDDVPEIRAYRIVAAMPAEEPIFVIDCAHPAGGALWDDIEWPPRAITLSSSGGGST
jgi:proteasome lid subunit RPN8/RPN11